MDAYLFVHFKEKKIPDGEQVYFGLSKDGLHWESVNKGNPVLESKKGEMGVRDHTIIRANNGKFYIFATDLSLANCFKLKYKENWKNVSRYGSKCLSMWESEDLVNWSEQKLIKLGNEEFGCIWAPDIIFDKKEGDYILHWSSSHVVDNYTYKAIFYSRTKNFEEFTYPQILTKKGDSGIIDAAIYEENGCYYRFVKSETNPAAIIMEKGNTLIGEYVRIPAFDEEMKKLQKGAYEAPTAYRLKDGRWCLMLDFYGVEGEGQGYVPFVTDDMDSGLFIRADESFSFPYGFKHGTVIAITLEEYERIKKCIG